MVKPLLTRGQKKERKGFDKAAAEKAISDKLDAVLPMACEFLQTKLIEQIPDKVFDVNVEITDYTLLGDFVMGAPEIFTGSVQGAVKIMHWSEESIGVIEDKMFLAITGTGFNWAVDALIGRIKDKIKVENA